MNVLYQHIIQPFQDFIYPPVCLTCEQLRTDRSSKLCSDCWNALTSILSTHLTWQEISVKFDREGVINDILSCYLFEKEGKLQEIVHLLKYSGIKSIGVELGRVIGRCMMQESNFALAEYLIPVPLHRIKQRERGYNQSEYICKGISELTKIPVHTSLLLRKKYTQSQTQLNLEERKQNVGDAFIIEKKFLSEVEGKTFILVDDVITTGSTINACARELLAHGATRVLTASAALAQ